MKSGSSRPINEGIIDESEPKSRNLFSNFENVFSGQKRPLMNSKLGRDAGLGRASIGQLFILEMGMS